MNDRDDAIIRRELDTHDDEPASRIATAVADSKGVEPSALEDMWGCAEDVREHLFSTPPADEARMVGSFSYEGFRIRVEQDGTAEFIAIEAA